MRGDKNDGDGRRRGGLAAFLRGYQWHDVRSLASDMIRLFNDVQYVQYNCCPRGSGGVEYF